MNAYYYSKLCCKKAIKMITLEWAQDNKVYARTPEKKDYLWTLNRLIITVIRLLRNSDNDAGSSSQPVIIHLLTFVLCKYER